MKILQTIKYYDPSKGGMESVAKDIVAGVIEQDPSTEFTIYANSHVPLFKRTYSKSPNQNSIKEFTPFIVKSQPVNLGYPLLSELIRSSDVVHHHYPFPTMELALIKNSKLLANKKFIITWHANINNSRWSWIGSIYTPIIKKLLDLATYIVVTSPQLADASDILALYKEKVKVIPLSFDPKIAQVNVQPKTFPADRPFKLLFVGKLRAYKGVSYLIGAVKDLAVNLYIVGDGEDKIVLSNQANALGARDKVFFRSGLSDEELADMYKQCDLFVLPSINEAEAFGVVQLEAMSNGLPVINTRLLSGVPYVSLDGISGLTVEPKNSMLIKNAIEKMISSKALFETCSQNAISRSKEFSREKMALAYLNLYSS